MSYHGYDPGDRNNWYQSPHLGLFPASPAASGGGISGGYYNSPYHSYGSSTCAFTQFSSPPNPYPPLQLNPSATIINGHMFPHQFPFVAQQPLTTTPRDPYIPTYHSPHPNPNLWVPLSISQSHSHEPSIPSVYSQFVPTNTMTTQPISHSASPPPTCGQPHTIADPKPLCPIPEYDRISLEPDRLHNWGVPIVDSGCYSFTPEHMTVLTGAEKPQSPQRRSGELQVHKDHTNAKLCEMQTSFQSSMETFMSEFREELRLLRSSQSPVLQVDNTPPTVATSLTASGKPSSSTTATSGGSIRISEPNFNLSPHEAILDLNNDISVVVVSGSSSEDNIAVGMTEKLVLNVDKNIAGGGTGMKFSGSHCSDVAKSILWKNNAQSHRFQHTNFGNGSSVGNLLIYCEVHTSMEVGNRFLDDNFGEENVSVEDSFEKMQMKSERVLVPPMRKVMHGAGRYIGWFQRAFGIYICNLFDTGQASKVLKLERDILDYLLHQFFDVSARKEDQNTNGYYDHSSSSHSIIANVPAEFQCPKSGQKLIHMAFTPNYALKRLLHQCSRSWIITIIFIFFCISVEKAIADTMKLTSEFLVGCLDVILAIKKYLNDKIEPWLAGIFCENGFLHDSDSKWGGIVTGKKLADLGAYYNDHHSDLGYFIYVVPVTSKIDLAWGKKYMSQAYSLGQKLNIQQGSSYFGIVPVILKEVFSFSSEMHCFSLVTIIFNVGMATTVQPFSRDWGFQVHQLWPPLMMMRCFSLPLSLLGNDYFKSTLLITAVTGFDVVALDFLYQTKASCHPRSFIVDEFFDFLKRNSKLSFVRYTCDALLSSDNCVGFLTNMHKFFQHMVGHVHKDEFFMATCSSTSCPPFHALVKKLFLLSPVVAIHSLQPLLADILRDDAQLIFGIMMVLSMNELMLLNSKKQGLEIGECPLEAMWLSVDVIELHMNFLENHMKLDEKCLGYVMSALDAPYRMQKLRFKFIYQNLLQLFFPYVSVFVIGEEFRSDLFYMQPAGLGKKTCRLGHGKTHNFCSLSDDAHTLGLMIINRASAFLLLRVTQLAQINRAANICLEHCTVFLEKRGVENVHKWGWYKLRIVVNAIVGVDYFFQAATMREFRQEDAGNGIPLVFAPNIQDNEKDSGLIVNDEDVRAGVVSHDDGMMIVEDDITDGDKEPTIPLLRNMFVHLQLPLLAKKTTLAYETCKIQETMDGSINADSPPIFSGFCDLALTMILYSLWLIRAWHKSMGYLPFEDSNYPRMPWFIYIFLDLGVTLCSGHVAADTANGYGFQMISCKGAQILIQNMKLEDKFV